MMNVAAVSMVNYYLRVKKLHPISNLNVSNFKSQLLDHRYALVSEKKAP